MAGVALRTHLRSPGRDRTALVLYGSETGNAQDLAEELGRLTERLHFSTRVTDLNSIVLTEFLQSTIVLIVISTTGQGDLPANAQVLWKRLRSARLKASCLTELNFTSFGLGDSSYPQFNWAHRKLHNRLKQLGAQVFFERGEADEQHPDGVDGLFLPWIARLKESLNALFPLREGQYPIADDAFLLPKWKAQIDGLEHALTISKTQPDLKSQVHAGTKAIVEEEDTNDTPPPDGLIPIPKSFPAALVFNKRLTPSSHWQDVRLFEFSCDSLPPTGYRPGDILTVYPKNFPLDVTQLLSLMGWSHIADLPLHFTPTSKAAVGEFYPPPPMQMTSDHYLTLRILLTNHLDITAIPRRSFFATLAHFTSDEAQHERLVEFTMPDFVDELYDYTTRPRRSILEVLQEFDTVRMPYQWVATLFPALRGRQFSIASGGVLKQPRGNKFASGGSCIQLLVAIVRYRTVIRRIRQGVCTRYMMALRPGSSISVSLAKSGMKVALDKPAIMIGPGTGVAPLRSMIWERRMQTPIDQSMTSVSKGLQVLFFGARNSSADYFFEDEWSVEDALLQVHAAFSRDQGVKVYVQDLIREHAKSVWDLVAAGGVIYICGSSGKMPQAVRQAIIEVFEQYGGDSMDRTQAEAYLMRLEKAERYQQETW